MQMFRVRMAGIVHLPDDKMDDPNWRDDRHFEKTVTAEDMYAAEQMGFRAFEQRAVAEGWDWVNIWRSWVYAVKEEEPEIYDKREWSFAK